jgi:predicted nucleic acid-binding protein
MRRLVVDTSVYIDYVNDGRHEDVLTQPKTVKYMSTVVLMELIAGAATSQERRLLGELEAHFRKVRRLLAPSAAVFVEAGDVLRRLRTERGFRMSSSNTIVNDVLIALSARSIGAAVVTQNKRDFLAIQAVQPFELHVVPVSR